MAASAYPVLQPSSADGAYAGRCALAIMAKAPRAGKVKTRLAPPLTLEQSAALNVCFLRDTAANIAGVAQHGAATGVVCYTPAGDEEAFDGLLPDGFVMIPQRGDGFGERLYCAATDLLSCGFHSVCLIDSDSPTLPHASLQVAVDTLLQPGGRVVLGGSDDGGYYLIGMNAPHRAVFERITWSTPSVLRETRARAAEAGLPVVELPLWYDVDDAATLRLLAGELLDGTQPPFAATTGYEAIATREYLRMFAASGTPPWKIA